MKRRIVQRKFQALPLTVDDRWVPEEWLLAHASEHGLTTLLAYADDGLIWGTVRDGALRLSSAAFPNVSPKLRAETLWEARLFGPEAEVHIWRVSERGWEACLVQDGPGAAANTFDEEQMLWGTSAVEEAGGFTLVRDGELGNRHAPPVPEDRLVFGARGSRPLRLRVRHYLATDQETGLVAVHLSRLVALLPEMS